MVNTENLKNELKDETEKEEIADEVQTQKVELAEEATSDELTLPFQRENITNYVWRLLAIRKVEIRDVVFNKTNQAGQVTYIDGWVIDNPELEEKVLNVIKSNQSLPIELSKEISKHKQEVYLFSTSQGIYYSVLRTVTPKLKQGTVIVGVAYQQSDYPQPMIVLVHPSQLLTLKKQYEALKSK